MFQIAHLDEDVQFKVVLNSLKYMLINQLSLA